jgi:membrane-associated phospholipid phosphatase
MNDFETRKFGVGLILVIILVKILKNTIKQPRPVMLKGSTWGMPSSRAACLFFIFTFLILMDNLSQTTKYILLGCALLGCTLKYLSKEHSLIQLIMGALVGMAMAKCIEKV